VTRRRSIVGIGEALLAEYPDREEPSGLAAVVAVQAVLAGHVGIAISRLGQDRPGEALLAALRERGVDVSHLQSDPDLATARLVFRALGGATLVDAHAAFDQLQWDFDLADVAQAADAVVYGALIRRSGQARSAVDRFLDECRAAVRVFDLTNRTDDELNRSHALSGLDYAEVAVVDELALHALVPGHGDEPLEAMVPELLRSANLQLVLVAQEGRPLAVHAAQGSAVASSDHSRDAHEASLIGFLHGTLAGWDLEASLELAQRLAAHAREHPGQAAPDALLQRP
jgi:sugar/nucleoside kinase (ribokinase family)